MMVISQIKEISLVERNILDNEVAIEIMKRTRLRVREDRAEILFATSISSKKKGTYQSEFLFWRIRVPYSCI